MAHRDNKEKEKTSREATGKYFYTSNPQLRA